MILIKPNKYHNDCYLIKILNSVQKTYQPWTEFSKIHSATIAAMDTFKNIPEMNLAAMDAFKNIPSSTIAAMAAFTNIPEMNLAAMDAFTNIPSSTIAAMAAFNNIPEVNLAAMDAFNNIPEVNLAAMDAFNNIPSSTISAMDAFKNIPEVNFAAMDAFNNIPSSTIAAMDAFKNIPSSTIAAMAAFKNIHSSTIATIAAINKVALPNFASIAAINSTIVTSVKTLEAFNLFTDYISLQIVNPQIKDIEYSNPDIIPIHPILKSEKTKERKKLFLEIQAIICDQNADYLLNTIAYEFLCELEVTLRNLIKKRIIEPYKKNLSNKIPQEMLDSWKTKKLAENPNSLENDDLIDYSDFADIKQILEKGKNKDLFKDIFPEQKMKAVTSKLHELEPIRKKIAHSRPLTKYELNKLLLYHYDILALSEK